MKKAYSSDFCSNSYWFFGSLSAKILPVVKKQHQLLVTLLFCNAAAMEVSMLVFIYQAIYLFSMCCFVIVE